MNDLAASRRGIRQKLLLKRRSKLRGMKPTGGNEINQLNINCHISIDTSRLLQFRRK